MELRELRSEEVVDLIYNGFWQTVRGFEGEGGEDPSITLLVLEDAIDFAVYSTTLFSRDLCHLFCIFYMVRSCTMEPMI